MIIDFLIENFFYFSLIAIMVSNYILLDTKFFLLRALNVFFTIDLFFCFMNNVFSVNYSQYYFIQSFFLFFFFFSKCFSRIKSDEVDDENVSIIFYKPKKIKQFLLSMFGLSYSSAGLVINRNIYQMRYEEKTLQKVPFKKDTEKYLKEKYLIINTGFKWKDLKGDWEGNLLSQSARQRRTLYLRFNCLRSLRFVLNQIPNYEYKHEYIFPCIYLYILKIKKVLKIYDRKRK